MSRLGSGKQVLRRTVAAALGTLVLAAGSWAVRGGTAWGAPRRIGYDISWPQCGRPFPPRPAFGIVGVGGGRAFTHNPCLAEQYRWAAAARRPPELYLNTGNPGTLNPHWNDPGPRPCSGADDDLGCAYNYGWNTAADALAYAGSQTDGAASGLFWWLDVETTNSWSANRASNVTVIQGILDYLRPRVKGVGIYSTGYQWGVITGGAQVALPNWVAGAANASQAATFCGTGFTGGRVRLVQFPLDGFDGDYRCPRA